MTLGTQAGSVRKFHIKDLFISLIYAILDTPPLLIGTFFYIMVVGHTTSSFLIGFGRFDCIGCMLLCPSFYIK